MSDDEYYNPQPQGGKNYFNSGVDNYGVFKLRIEPRQDVEEYLLLIGGIERDARGKQVFNQDAQLMNNEGIRKYRSIVYAHVNKNAHLTKYDRDRINEQARMIFKNHVKWLILNKKKYVVGGVGSIGILQSSFENLVYTAMSRSEEGFEANISGKQISVSEISDNRKPQEQERTGIRRFIPFMN